MIVYRCEDTLEGIFTAIYNAYEEKRNHEDTRITVHEEYLLFAEYVPVVTDIDKAIKIIRTTEHEEDVVPNLEKGFDIDTVQAEYIADIKLRHLNREYIIERIAEIENLQKEIDELRSILASEKKLKKYIAKQLKKIKDGIL